MGIYLAMSISKSVTKEEWKSVYQESLRLLEAFPLAEIRKVTIHGIDVYALVRSRERIISEKWGNHPAMVGWRTTGDYKYMLNAEVFCLRRDMVDKSYNPDAPDALFCTLPECNGEYAYYPWGNKTQGEPYHIYLLAIACMIQSRLGNKAYLYGDICESDCQKAVELANQFLERPIVIPDQFDPDRLYQRIKTFPLSEIEKIGLYIKKYRGIAGNRLGEAIRKYFSESLCKQYWEQQFGLCKGIPYALENEVHNYLSWGFNSVQLLAFFSDNEMTAVDQIIADLNRCKEVKNDRLSAREEIWDGVQEKMEKDNYDICEVEELQFFQTGKRIAPALIKNIEKNYAFYHRILSEEEYKWLMSQTKEIRCKWLAQENRTVLLRETEWEKVFDDICEHQESFARYYPMGRVRTTEYTRYLVHAIVTNDDFYAFVQSLAKE